MKSFILNNKLWLLPILAMLIITSFTPALDLAMSRYFYQGDSGFSNNAFFTFMYNYGFYPGDLTALAAGIGIILSFCSEKFKSWRKPALVLFLTMAIGAGLFVHAALKDHWGRPRPKQVIEFGGSQPFRPYYKPNFFHQPQPSKSFTCGHCSTGFYFFALALVGRRLNNKPIFWIGMFLAVTLGILLSLTRIAQGGHFFSDTLMTALIMWLTAYACDHFVYYRQQI